MSTGSTGSTSSANEPIRTINVALGVDYKTKMKEVMKETEFQEKVKSQESNITTFSKQFQETVNFKTSLGQDRSYTLTPSVNAVMKHYPSQLATLPLERTTDGKVNLEPTGIVQKDQIKIIEGIIKPKIEEIGTKILKEQREILLTEHAKAELSQQKIKKPTEEQVNDKKQEILEKLEQNPEKEAEFFEEVRKKGMSVLEDEVQKLVDQYDPAKTSIDILSEAQKYCKTQNFSDKEKEERAAAIFDDVRDTLQGTFRTAVSNKFNLPK